MSVAITLNINGERHDVVTEPRRMLVDVVRDECGLTGTHIGCAHGVCGACTIIVDGEAIRSCLMFAVQADGCEIRTVEDLANGRTYSPAAGRVRGVPCRAMRILYAGLSHARDGAARPRPGRERG